MAKKKLANHWGEFEEEEIVKPPKKKKKKLRNPHVDVIKDVKDIIEEELIAVEEQLPSESSYQKGYNEGVKATLLFIKNFIDGE